MTTKIATLINILIISTSLVGCGTYEIPLEDPNQQNTEEETEEGTQDTHKPQRIPTATSTSTRVDVTVEVSTEIQDEDWPELLRRGLTMDQVENIMGEPDDSYMRAGGGLQWAYEEGAPGCLEGYSCSIFFNKDQELEYMTGINPEFKDHRRK